MNKQEFLTVEVDYPEAKEWSNITSLIQDIDSTIQICNRLVEALPKKNGDRILLESLWTTALIKYARCFATGKRFGLSLKIFAGLKGDPVGAHNFYIDMRNKHVAHSVNPFEQVKTGLVLSDPKIEKKIKGVVTFSQWHISAQSDGVETLKNLCLVLRAKLSESGKKLHEETLKKAKEISIENLYAKAQLKTIAPGPKDAGKSRN